MDIFRLPYIRLIQALCTAKIRRMFVVQPFFGNLVYRAKLAVYTAKYIYYVYRLHVSRVHGKSNMAQPYFGNTDINMCMVQNHCCHVNMVHSPMNRNLGQFYSHFGNTGLHHEVKNVIVCATLCFA
jgi:hypothetical protein